MERRYVRAVELSGELPCDSYLWDVPAVRYLRKAGRLEFSHDVTFLVGENGTGKSTLLEAIAVACGFNAEGGSRNFSFSTKDTHSALHHALTVVRLAYPKDGFFLRAESLYNAASYLDSLDDMRLTARNYGGSLHTKSHGESFLALVQNRFGGQGLYFLDEPEAALSPMRMLTLLAELDRLVKMNSQFIIATHSPILMAFPGAEILQITEEGIRPAAYRETEHYIVTRRFLEKPEQMLKYLLED